MAQSQRTLSQLITSIRQVANQETLNPSSAFATDDEIKDRIVEAQYELYDLMLAADEHLFVTSYAFTLSSVNTLALSSIPDPGFYRFVGLDYQAGGPTPATVHRFSFAERNRRSGVNFAGTYTLWYTPRLTEMAALTDKLDVFTDNYRNWIIKAVAAVIMAKAEESDPSSVLQDKEIEGQRILGALAGRGGEPTQVPDVSCYDWGVGYAGPTGYADRAYSLEGGNLVIR